MIYNNVQSPSVMWTEIISYQITCTIILLSLVSLPASPFFFIYGCVGWSGRTFSSSATAKKRWRFVDENIAAIRIYYMAALRDSRNMFDGL